MRRRDFLAAMLLAAILRPANAQGAGKTWHVGFLDTAARDLNAENMSAFLKGMKELGYEEGKNLRIEYRTAEGRNERLPELATQLVKSNVDLIAVRGTPEVLAAKSATNSIPIVMLAVVDPVTSGVASSLSHPGGNVTGMSSSVTLLEAKRLGLFKELPISCKSLAFLGDLRNPAVVMQWNQVEVAARTLDIVPTRFEITEENSIRSAFQAIHDRRLDAVRVGVDGVTRPNRKLIIELAETLKLPAMYADREFTEDGGLMSYGAHYPTLYYRAASIIDKIFRGTSAAEIPIEQPTKFELTINLKAAGKLNLEFPPKLLALADGVIE
jgi:putative tryptophan/tyrosine transport system substrate-binding protein